MLSHKDTLESPEVKRLRILLEGASKEIRDLQLRVSITERQLERLGAPQYRVVYKGKKR